jgi:hypothetical protein
MRNTTPFPDGMVIEGINSVIDPRATSYYPRFRESIFNNCKPVDGKTIVRPEDFIIYEVVNVQNASFVYGALSGNVDYMRMEIPSQETAYTVGIWRAYLGLDSIKGLYQSLSERLPTSVEELETWDNYYIGSPSPILMICGIPIMVFSLIYALYNINDIKASDFYGNKYDVMAYLQSLADGFKKEVGKDFPTAIKNLKSIGYILL